MRRRRPSGFTLVEVLVVLALITLMAGLTVGSLVSILDGTGTPSLDRQLKRAVRDARYEAAARKEVTRLRFDAEAGAFRVTSETGEELHRYESGYGEDSRLVAVQFLQVMPTRGLEPPNRREVRTEIDSVRFHPDRSSTPFAAELKVDGETTLRRYDPFSDIEFVDEP